MSDCKKLKKGTNISICRWRTSERLWESAGQTTYTKLRMFQSTSLLEPRCRHSPECGHSPVQVCGMWYVLTWSTQWVKSLLGSSGKRLIPISWGWEKLRLGEEKIEKKSSQAAVFVGCPAWEVTHTVKKVTIDWLHYTILHESGH